MSGSITGDLRVSGDLRVGGTIKPDRPRSNLALESAAEYPLDLSTAQVWDSGQPLPAAAANDDLGFIVGTWGTNTPVINAGDVKATSSTRRARMAFKASPPKPSPVRQRSSRRRSD